MVFLKDVNHRQDNGILGNNVLQTVKADIKNSTMILSLTTIKIDLPLFLTPQLTKSVKLRALPTHYYKIIYTVYKFTYKSQFWSVGWCLVRFIYFLNRVYWKCFCPWIQIFYIALSSLFKDCCTLWVGFMNQHMDLQVAFPGEFLFTNITIESIFYIFVGFMDHHMHHYVTFTGEFLFTNITIESIF